MRITPEQIDEINALLLFDLNNPLDGIKIHSDADPVMVSAIKRLFDKGLTTLVDGGYLTDSGKKAADHADLLLILLR